LYTCPNKGCKVTVPDEVVRQFVIDREYLAKYDRLLINSFVTGQEFIKWCPKRCGYAVEFKLPGANAIKCPCLTRYCFSCGKEPHAPLSCELATTWLKKIQLDGSLAWSEHNCPSCDQLVHKTKYGKSVDCLKCKNQFCSLCKRSWSKHIGVDCAKIVANLTGESKFVYYYHRFRNSHEDRQFLEKDKETFEARTRDLEISHWYVSHVYEKLIQAQITLQWTYALAYYLPEKELRGIFDCKQTLMKDSIERVHGMMETPANYFEENRNYLTNHLNSLDKMVKEIERFDFEQILSIENERKENELSFFAQAGMEENMSLAEVYYDSQLMEIVRSESVKERNKG